MLTTLRVTFVSIGAKVSGHGRYVTFWMARVALFNLQKWIGGINATIVHRSHVAQKNEDLIHGPLAQLLYRSSVR